MLSPLRNPRRGGPRRLFGAAAPASEWTGLAPPTAGRLDKLSPVHSAIEERSQVRELLTGRLSIISRTQLGQLLSAGLLRVKFSPFVRVWSIFQASLHPHTHQLVAQALRDRIPGSFGGRLWPTLSWSTQDLDYVSLRAIPRR